MIETSEPAAAVVAGRVVPARGKRWLERLALVFFSLVLTEVGVALAYFVATGEWLDYGRMAALRDERRGAGAPPGPQRGSADQAKPAYLRAESVHPYAGYLRDPTGEGDADQWPVPAGGPLFQPPLPNRLVVLVVGGSVAVQVGDPGVGRDAMASAIASVAGGREVVIVSLGQGGFKQPQQLTLLSYVLALGGHPDVVVNLDGFNDVVLPWVDNARHGVYPVYPRQWNLRVSSFIDVARDREIGAITSWRDVRTALAATFGAPPWRWSATANVIWFCADRWIGQVLDRHERALRDQEAQGSYQSLGPRQRFDYEQTLKLAVDTWAEASVQMHHLADANHFLYVHVLQPNQYVERSKPLTDEERRFSYRPDEPYGQTARAGYPLLIARGEQLRAAGVRFHDLTPLFAREERTVYEDWCCHFDALGQRMLGQRIGELVAAELAAR